MTPHVCEKCGAKIYAVGELKKCPSCGHYYDPGAYGKVECDCGYCKGHLPQQLEEE